MAMDKLESSFNRLSRPAVALAKMGRRSGQPEAICSRQKGISSFLLYMPLTGRTALGGNFRYSA
jgi:hypothetical protein